MVGAKKSVCSVSWRKGGMEGRLGQGEEIYCRLLGEMRGTNRREGWGGGKGGATQQQPFLHICASLSGEHKKMNGE